MGAGGTGFRSEHTGVPFLRRGVGGFSITEVSRQRLGTGQVTQAEDDLG